MRLRFSGATTESSGAESSTSRSDSGELGGPFRDGDSFMGSENRPALRCRGLLGDDSDPVSWSVSVDNRCRLEPGMEQSEKQCDG